MKWVVVLSLTTLLALAAPKTAMSAGAPPKPDIPGLQPTTATLSDVLHLFNEERRAERAVTETESWDVETGGLTGKRTDIYDGDDYEQTEAIGPFTHADGRYKGQAWVQDRNGFTVLVKNAQTVDTISQKTLTTALSGAVTDGISLVGEVESPPPSYVLEIHPKGGRHEFLFVDKQTGTLVRRIEYGDGLKNTTTYDDFRTVDGVRRAWHVHWSNGLPHDESDNRMTSFSTVVPNKSQALALPATHSFQVEFPAGKDRVDLPVQFADGVVVVRLNIGGRAVDFQLDTGATGIIIDSGLAGQLNLPLYGTLTASTAGTYISHLAIVPKMDAGGMILKNIVVSALPFTYKPERYTRIMGLLGFDFIANTVLHLDYEKNVLTAIRPEAFKPPKDATVLPIDLQDFVPAVQGGVGGTEGRFVVDTGSFITSIFSEFADEHQSDVKDIGGRRYGSDYPLIQADGVGGSFFLKPVQVSRFSAFALNIANWPTTIAYAPPTFQDPNYIGLLGEDFLRYFDLYIDYSNLKIYAVPNGLFKKDFKITS